MILLEVEFIPYMYVGWIMEINVTDATEFSNLLTEEEYTKFLESDENH